jgi:hypothetical protein
MHVNCCVCARPDGISSVYIYLYDQEHTISTMPPKHFCGIGYLPAGLNVMRKDYVKGEYLERHIHVHGCLWKPGGATPSTSKKQGKGTKQILVG